MTEHNHGPQWEIVTDENGNDFHAFSDSPEGDATRDFVTFITGDNGFGQSKGCVVIPNLKKLPTGKYGA